MLKQIFLISAVMVLTAVTAQDVIAVRRMFRTHAEQCNYEAGFLIKKIHDPDVEIARYAIILLGEKHPAAAVQAFKSFTGKLDPLIAEALLTALASCPGKESEALQKKILASCDDPRLRAFSKSKLPFRMNLSLRNDPAYDHAVTVIKKIPLPMDNWKFTTDPDDSGYDKKFYAVGFNDREWKNISIGKTWEEQGFANYDGIAWYRIKFTMPPKGSCNGVDIAFEAVDESTWVWINGKFVGQHDVGGAGWNTPFFLNIASEIQWGRENTLTVRVKDTAQAGGIWKPVFIEVLK